MGPSTGPEEAPVGEDEWLNTWDPRLMLRLLGPRRSRRKMRLFGCAACRHVWPRLADEVTRRAIEVAERFADGEADASELNVFSAAAAASGRRTAPAPVAEPSGPNEAFAGLSRALSAAGAAAGESLVQCLLLRDIFGNPFRPVRLGTARLTDTVASLALAAYEERELPSGHLQTVRLAILADALEEEGWGAGPLEHLRSPGPHVRGCWGVDEVLGWS